MELGPAPKAMLGMVCWDLIMVVYMDPLGRLHEACSCVYVCICLCAQVLGSRNSGAPSNYLWVILLGTIRVESYKRTPPNA